MLKRVGLLAGVAAALALGAWLGWHDANPPSSVGDPSQGADEAAAGDARVHLTGRGTPHAAGGAEDAIDFTRLPGPDVRVRGVVRAAGAPLAGALVELRAPEDRGVFGWQSAAAWTHVSSSRRRSPEGALAAVSTGSDGTFESTVSRRSRLLLRVTARGYAARQHVVWVPVRGDPPACDIELAPGFEVAGVLVRSGRVPVARTTVRLRARARYGPPRPDGPELAVATTADDGRFRLGAQRAGAYALHAQVGERCVVRYPVEIPTHGELRIELPTPVSLSGGVTDAAGAPVSGAQIRVYVERVDGTSAEATATSRADGAYQVADLVPGPVENVTVTPRAGIALTAAQGDLHVVLPVLFPAAAATLDIVLPTRGRLAGRAVSRAGGRVPGARVGLFRLDPRVEVALVTATADGTFGFDGLATGRYGLFAQSADGEIAGYLPDEAWSPKGGIAFDAAAPGPGIEITLGPLGAVEGRLDNAPQGWSGIALLVAGTFRAEVDVSPAGVFVMPAVPPCTGAQVLLRSDAFATPRSDLFEIRPGEIARPVIRFPERPWIQGVVTDVEGRPVVGAYVSMERDRELDFFRHGTTPPPKPPWTGVRTDAAGGYRLPYDGPHEYSQPEPDAWSLSVHHPAHASAVLRDLGVPTAGNPLTVDVTLGAGCIVSGRVLTPAGLAAAGARVELVQSGLLHAVADGDGRFAVHGVAKGAFQIRASHDDARFPAQAGTWLEVEDPQDDLVLTLEPLPLLQGTVVDDEGNPLPRVAIRARVPKAPDDNDDLDERMASIPPAMRERLRQRLGVIGEERVALGATDAFGRFRLECVKPGEFQLVIAPGWGTTAGFLTTETRTYPTGSLDLVVPVRVGGRITGRVVGGDGRPVAHADVIGAWAEPDGWGSVMTHENYRPMTSTGADGRFTLKGLDPGRVDLVVAARGYLPLHERQVPVGSDVTLGLERGDVIEGRVLRPDGEPFVGLALEIARVEKRAVGRVGSLELLRRRRESMEAMVGAAVIHSQLQGRDQATTDREGRFVFSGLAPGTYEILLARAMVGADDPIFPKSVVHSDNPPLTIATRAALTISGTVLDPEGKPISFYDRTGLSRPQVSAYQAEGYKTWTGATSWDFVEVDGRFALGGLQPGPVRLAVEAGDGYSSARIETEAGVEGLRVVLHVLTEEERAEREKEAERERQAWIDRMTGQAGEDGD